MYLAHKVWSINPVSYSDEFASPQAAQGHNARVGATRDVIAAMNRLYSIRNMKDNSPSADLEDASIEIAVQTIECGIFLQQYMSNTGGQPTFSQVQVLQVLMVNPFLPNSIPTGVGDAEHCIKPFKRFEAP